MSTYADLLAVQRVAQDFTKREFFRISVFHDAPPFETEPDPHPPPHLQAHLIMKAAGLDGICVNPRKTDLQRWREGFAEALREHGIEATTTSRLHRTNQERWTVRHLHEATRKGERLERLKRTTRRHGRVQEILRNYEQVMRTLARSDRGEDRQLAADLVRYLGGRGRAPDTERRREKDRER